MPKIKPFFLYLQIIINLSIYYFMHYLKIIAFNGSAFVGSVVSSANLDDILNTIVQIVILIVTLLQLIKKDKKTEEK